MRKFDYLPLFVMYLTITVALFVVTTWHNPWVLAAVIVGQSIAIGGSFQWYARRRR